MTVLLALVTLSSPAHAHKPWVAAPDAYTRAEDAFPIEDPDVSIVVYAERGCAGPQLWLTADVSAGQELFAQLGLPQAETLAGWRPSLAVVAPGLPDADLGFPLPDGFGAVAFEGAAEPEAFDEPFSGTSDWILVEERVTLPTSGAAYVVAWDPAGSAGRLWIATGERESFTSDDWNRIGDLMDDVRDFHGLEGRPVPAPVTCAAADPAGEDTEGAAVAGGCATTASRPGPGGIGATGLVVAWALARARRPRD